MNEIEKIVKASLNPISFGREWVQERLMRRKLRALARKAYWIGKHHGEMVCPRKEANNYFKFVFGFKP